MGTGKAASYIADVIWMYNQGRLLWKLMYLRFKLRMKFNIFFAVLFEDSGAIC